MLPTKGRIVLFHSWRRPEEAAALVTGVLAMTAAEQAGTLLAVKPGEWGGAFVNLIAFHNEGVDEREIEVPFWGASDEELVLAAAAWRRWDAECDAARAARKDIPRPPSYPQRSWRWPPRVDVLVVADMVSTASPLEVGIKPAQPDADARLKSLDAAEEAGRQWYRDGKPIDGPVPAHIIADQGHEIAFARGYDALAAATADETARRTAEGGRVAGDDAGDDAGDAAEDDGQFDRTDTNAS